MKIIPKLLLNTLLICFTEVMHLTSRWTLGWMLELMLTDAQIDGKMDSNIMHAMLKQAQPKSSYLHILSIIENHKKMLFPSL